MHCAPTSSPKPLGRRCIALGGQQKIQRAALLIDRSIKVFPSPLNLHLGLVDTPRITGHFQMRPTALVDLRREALYPTIDRRMCHLQSTIHASSQPDSDNSGPSDSTNERTAKSRSLPKWRHLNGSSCWSSYRFSKALIYNRTTIG